MKYKVGDLVYQYSEQTLAEVIKIKNGKSPSFTVNPLLNFEVGDLAYHPFDIVPDNRWEKNSDNVREINTLDLFEFIFTGKRIYFY
jgi:hypothetical protein